MITPTSVEPYMLHGVTPKVFSTHSLVRESIGSPVNESFSSPGLAEGARLGLEKLSFTGPSRAPSARPEPRRGGAARAREALVHGRADGLAHENESFSSP